MTEGQQLARALRAAYWAMHRRTNAILQRYGVTADQFVLLSRLSDQDAITQQELAFRAASDPNTVRSMLVLLQKRGFVTRRRHSSDGRANLVLLTATGRRMFFAMMNATAHCRRQMLSAVIVSSPAALLRNLNQIAEILNSPPSDNSTGSLRVKNVTPSSVKGAHAWPSRQSRQRKRSRNRLSS
jgi:MarR family transcriptional regulator, lower aerobic nicotinate degradation pathway regulator